MTTRTDHESGGHLVDDPRDEIPLIALLAAFMRRLPLIVGVVAVFSFFGVVRVLTSLHQANASFVPSDNAASALGGLGGLAAQLGVSVGDESIFYYAELVRSRRLRRATAETAYRVQPEENGAFIEGTLVDLLEVEGDTPGERLKKTVNILDDLITVGTAAEANVVRVTTLAPYPDLAVAMNERVLELINEFNMERRRQQAAAEMAFVLERLDEARAELREAEEELATFLERNRRFEGSPQLEFEAARLERTITLREGVYRQLAQAVEQARIEAARNTPVITPLDLPAGSVRRARSLLSTLAVWTFVGFVVASAIVAGLIFLGRQRSREPEAYSELVRSALRYVPFSPGRR